jgi:hypothetical protein
MTNSKMGKKNYKRKTGARRKLKRADVSNGVFKRISSKRAWKLSLQTPPEYLNDFGLRSWTNIYNAPHLFSAKRTRWQCR